MLLHMSELQIYLASTRHGQKALAAKELYQLVISKRKCQKNKHFACWFLV